MPFTLPDFNITADVWFSPNDPFTGPADQTGINVQFYIPSRGLLDITPGSFNDWVPPLYLRIDPTAAPLNVLAWIWEVPSGTGKYYRVRFKETMHVGFTNEYPMHILEQCTDTGAATLHDVVP